MELVLLDFLLQVKFNYGFCGRVFRKTDAKNALKYMFSEGF